MRSSNRAASLHAPGSFTGHAVRVGINTALDKWRCKTCKFMNDADVTHCKTCREERKIEPKSRFPDARGVYGGKPAVGKPRQAVTTRPQRAVPVSRAAPISRAAPASRPVPVRKAQSKPAGTRPQGGIISTSLAKPPPPKPKFDGGNIMTFKQYDQENKSVPGEAKKPRFHKEPNLQMLKRIAMNSEDGDTMPCMRKLKQKQFVQNARDPAKFNMHTFVREYGDVPK